ncbi:hypothetical protein PFUGPA_04924 [Plasmodium falciparum Palo Alto/Uganda]|uniref:Uncharacterized protein n=2 Tax=Plasmodium falciparum TaxID=5833 RepID=W4IV97_PLAFP|nr:hypothetical protein PFUGPA_04924 [Plasmodium falciparum Palo Alto/Uganda]EUR75555.1 hypothetical protein PFBG_01297 [Plasmodium falciparum 7G8]
MQRLLSKSTIISMIIGIKFTNKWFLLHNIKKISHTLPHYKFYKCCNYFEDPFTKDEQYK